MQADADTRIDMHYEIFLFEIFENFIKWLFQGDPLSNIPRNF